MNVSTDLKEDAGPKPGVATLEPVSESGFDFSCHKGLSCFTKCCRDLNLQLTPYDILRMRRSLNLTSSALLEQLTFSEVDPEWGILVVKLKMNEDHERSCPFVTQDGCTIYQDRPGACRSYPLGRAARKARHVPLGGTEEQYFVVREEHCLGFNEGTHWAVDTWKDDQGLAIYNTMNDVWLGFVAARGSWNHLQFTQKQWNMFYMACYSLDSFRRFVFDTKFLRVFDLKDDEIDKLRSYDEELMKFAF